MFPRPIWMRVVPYFILTGSTFTKAGAKVFSGTPTEYLGERELDFNNGSRLWE